MQTTIYVSGQISGNFALRSALLTSEFEEVKDTMFNGFAFYFRTKKQAEKALWQAYKELKARDKQASYHAKDTLYYDASKAYISVN